MNRNENEELPQRRRGKELERAILEAAWQELVEVGYGNLTMESVASRAHTGIAVLYRRWANKDQLTLAALRNHRETHAVEIPDTGSLRGDMIAVLTRMGNIKTSYFAIAFSSGFAGLISNTGMTIAQVRETVLGGDSPSRALVICQRAHDRGEIDLTRIPQSLIALPYDLVRHDMLMSLSTVSAARIESIVDEIFLPLIRAYQ